MNPFQVLIFLVFHLPIMLIREGLALFSKFLGPIDTRKLLWRIPYVLVVILSILVVVLWLKGYR